MEKSYQSPIVKRNAVMLKVHNLTETLPSDLWEWLGKIYMTRGFGKLPMSADQGLYPLGGAISRLSGKGGDRTEARLEAPGNTRHGFNHLIDISR